MVCPGADLKVRPRLIRRGPEVLATPAVGRSIRLKRAYMALAGTDLGVGPAVLGCLSVGVLAAAVGSTFRSKRASERITGAHGRCASTLGNAGIWRVVAPAA